MKIFKNILIAIAAVILLVLIIAALAPSDIYVKRDVTIKKSKSEVFDYVKYLKNQDEFATWSQIDPNMKKEFTGIDGTVGFVSAWDSNHPDVGKGEQEIINIDLGNQIDYELRFLEPWESTSTATMEFSSIDSVTTNVSWDLKGDMPYPMNLMLLFIDMDETVGGDLEKGLNSLKGILEN